MLTMAGAAGRPELLPESKKAAKLLFLLQPAGRPFDYYSQSYSFLSALGDGRYTSFATRGPDWATTDITICSFYDFTRLCTPDGLPRLAHLTAQSGSG